MFFKKYFRKIFIPLGLTGTGRTQASGRPSCLHKCCTTPSGLATQLYIEGSRLANANAIN